MNLRWLVIWSHNGFERWESFEFRLTAEIKMIHLESWGMKPSLVDLHEQPELMKLLMWRLAMRYGTDELEDVNSVSVN